MSKFCRVCGHLIIDGKKFCPHCGSAISLQKTCNVAYNDNILEEKRKKWTKIIIISFCLISIILYIGLLCKNDWLEIKNFNDILKFPKNYFKVTKILQDNNIKGKILATTIGNNEKGYLLLLKSENKNKIIVIDDENKRIAEVKDDIKFKGNDCVMFKMIVYNDANNLDKESGIWYGKDHLLPIYALLDIDKNIITRGLYTADGENPSRYHDTLKEAENVNMVELFITEAYVLEKKCLDNNVNWKFSDVTSSVTHSYSSEQVMSELYGKWKMNGTGMVMYITPTHYNGFPYSVQNAYITDDGIWLYAFLEMDNTIMKVRAWRVKDAGSVFNALCLEKDMKRPYLDEGETFLRID